VYFQQIVQISWVEEDHFIACYHEFVTVILAIHFQRLCTSEVRFVVIEIKRAHFEEIKRASHLLAHHATFEQAHSFSFWCLRQRISLTDLCNFANLWTTCLNSQMRVEWWFS
jgi:hypothetical protein